AARRVARAGGPARLEAGLPVRELPMRPRRPCRELASDDRAVARAPGRVVDRARPVAAGSRRGDAQPRRTLRAARDRATAERAEPPARWLDVAPDHSGR